MRIFFYCNILLFFIHDISLFFIHDILLFFIQVMQIIGGHANNFYKSFILSVLKNAC